MQRRQRQQQKQDFILHLQVWVFRLPAPLRRLVRRLHLMVLKHFLWKQREAVAIKHLPQAQALLLLRSRRTTNFASRRQARSHLLRQQRQTLDRQHHR